jgi:3-hydroxyacyl-CoA dehydrogenase
VERMDVKRQVMERIEQAARKDAVISTNTSGLPIGEIAAGRSEEFRRRFLGTHFFNPPRYLKLLELIPTEDTDPEILARVAHFGRLHLGKGIVVAKDRPYFIGNRVGVYGMMKAMQYYTDGRYSIEEIDALTGPIVGRPKSATFRTADVVGLDVLAHVASNLYEKVPEDESRDAFRIPPVLGQLVQSGALGEKTKAGFYKKEGGEIRSLNPQAGQYESPKELNLGDVKALQKAGGLDDRLRALYRDQGRAGAFFRETTLDLLGYSARRIPEITDSPADVDRAIRWGFGWEKGPFEIWDALGFEAVLEDMQAEGVVVPDWVQQMQSSGKTAFYREENGRREVYVPEEGGFVEDERPADEISLAAVKSGESRMLWQNEEAALLDLGDGVALYEFRSKANSLGRNVMLGLMEVIERVESDPNLRGLVIGNEGNNFSVGANLGEVAMAAAAGQFAMIEQFVAGFQQAIQRIRYAAKPVVVAVHQRVLGGGCEMVMACPNPVAAAESYVGLVELGVGLIPAGTGTMRLAALAAEQSPNPFPSQIQPYVQKYFENVAMAKVATSAAEAQQMGYLVPSAQVVMNAERRLYVAKQEVIRLSNEGYLPPPVKTHIRVLGRPTYAALEIGVRQYKEGNFISEYDQHLALQFAYVLTGGALSGMQEVHEDYLIDLEREVFMRLLGEKKTQERITAMLMEGKPLRN